MANTALDDRRTQRGKEKKTVKDKLSSNKNNAIGDSTSIGEDSLERLYEESMRHISEGELVKGKVVKVTSSDVIVDIGFKSDGLIPLSEFAEGERPKEGDSVDVILEAIENQDGQIILSKQKADFVRVWDQIKEAYDLQSIIHGKILRRVKGGMVADIFGVEAFLPGSQISTRKIANMDEIVGQSLPMKIIKLNRKRRNIVVSSRIVLEEEREKQRASIVADLEKGQLREGVVKNITDFGAFIDLGGMDGLLHITDMSWGRISHPSEMLAIGDRIMVKIIEFDREKQRVSLGLKQLTPPPWEKVEEKYPVGSKVTGKVVSITNYGAFVELEKGVEGLVHISEMSWTRQIKHPSKVVAIGDSVEVVVLKIDKSEEKISLGLKQSEPDPWLSVDDRYPVGSKVTGKVRNLTSYGVFVELEEGVDGLVHVSDLSWTKKVKHPSEITEKGDKIEVVILNIDKEARRISLGMKQVTENPWPTVEKNFPAGSIVEGIVIGANEKGLVVELEGGFEGFVPPNEIEDGENISEKYTLGKTVKLKVLRVDQGNLRVVLSQKVASDAYGSPLREKASENV